MKLIFHNVRNCFWLVKIVDEKNIGPVFLDDSPDMFAVVGRGLYSDADPNHFGNLFVSLFTLFQLLTLDDWFEIYKTVSQNDPSTTFVSVTVPLHSLFTSLNRFAHYKIFILH